MIALKEKVLGNTKARKTTKCKGNESCPNTYTLENRNST